MKQSRKNRHRSKRKKGKKCRQSKVNRQAFESIMDEITMIERIERFIEKNSNDWDNENAELSIYDIIGWVQSELARYGYIKHYSKIDIGESEIVEAYKITSFTDNIIELTHLKNTWLHIKSRKETSFSENKYTIDLSKLAPEVILEDIPETNNVYLILKSHSEQNAIISTEQHHESFGSLKKMALDKESSRKPFTVPCIHIGLNNKEIATRLSKVLLNIVEQYYAIK